MEGKLFIIAISSNSPFYFKTLEYKAFLIMELPPGNELPGYKAKVG
jgi:hypothetical protein